MCSRAAFWEHQPFPRIAPIFFQAKQHQAVFPCRCFWFVIRDRIVQSLRLKIWVPKDSVSEPRMLHNVYVFPPIKSFFNIFAIKICTLASEYHWEGLPRFSYRRKGGLPLQDHAKINAEAGNTDLVWAYSGLTLDMCNGIFTLFCALPERSTRYIQLILENKKR